MAATILSNLAVAGAKKNFYMSMTTAPVIWPRFCQMVDMSTQTEPLVFPGFLPQPRQYIDGRTMQGLRDFRYNVDTLEYELSMLIDRNSIEDDQTGTIMARFTEMGAAWETYKDYLFSQLLVNGATSGNNGWDGTTFFSDTRTIGASANIDNKGGGTAEATTIPTSAEILPVLQTDLATMALYQDDHGRPFNTMSMAKKSIILPPIYEKPFAEAINATLVPSVAGTASQDNPWAKGLADIIVFPYLTAVTKDYILLTGHPTRKPFIFGKRTEFELVILNTAEEVAKNHGVLVLARQRFVITYGEPRMALEQTWA